MRTDESMRVALAASMDVEPALYPVMAELFAGLSDLGGRAVDVMAMLPPDLTGQRCLDMGCGKGAVAVALAARGATVTGIDGYAPFLADATAAAVAAGVEPRCRFVEADLCQVAHEHRGLDIVVMLALGDVFGDLAETLQALRPMLRPGASLVIDDAVTAPGVSVDPDVGVMTPEAWTATAQAHGFALADSRSMHTDEHRAWLLSAAEQVSHNAEALCERHPALAETLTVFAQRQREELASLSDLVRGATFRLVVAG